MNPVQVTLSIHSNNQTVTLGFDEKIIGGDALPWYEGEYVVTPKVHAQTLETRNKSMRENVSVEAIPYSEVTNPSGGLTANIAFVL
jgi:hypothetical protein